MSDHLFEKVLLISQSLQDKLQWLKPQIPPKIQLNSVATTCGSCFWLEYCCGSSSTMLHKILLAVGRL